jgi:hypothetical protein
MSFLCIAQRRVVAAAAKEKIIGIIGECEKKGVSNTTTQQAATVVAHFQFTEMVEERLDEWQITGFKFHELKSTGKSAGAWINNKVQDALQVSLHAL